MTDTEIAAVRTAADTITDGGVVGLTISGALVTYLKPLAQDAGTSDPAGFFIQGTQNGSAIFVAIDPATVTGGPFAVGDLVDITVQTVSKLNGVRLVTAVSGASRSSSGNPVSGLSAAIDMVDFLAAGQVDLFESRLINVTAAAINSAPVTAGAGYKAVNISTMGTPDAGSNFRLRMPAAVMDALILGPGCTFSAGAAPLWRNGNSAQPSVWAGGELMNVTCPPPASVSAYATTNTSATVVFNRDLVPGTVTAGAFTVVAAGGGPLAVSAATPIHSRAVALTTGSQVDGTVYNVTVANTVTDTRGTPVGSGNMASFTGAATSVCNSGVVISTIYGGGNNSGATYSHDYVELKNRTPAAISLAGWSLQYSSATGNFSAQQVVPLSGTIPANGFFLVRLASQTGGTAAALPTLHDVDGPNVNLSGSAGVLALVPSTAVLPACPAVGSVADLVGYGTSAACREMTPTSPNLSNTTAAFRGGNGCNDTNVNSADFANAALAGGQVPRNSQSNAVVCTCP